MDFEITEQRMICGSAEAERHVYQKVVGKSGRTWLFMPDSADNIYVSGDKGSQGFAGRTLTFKLEDGSEMKLTGPWHSNSRALFDDTGVDLRAKHMTFVVIAEGRKCEAPRYQTILTNVIYKDEAPQRSEFKRGDTMAQKLANELGKTLYVYSQTAGGSSCGPVNPEESNGNPTR